MFSNPRCLDRRSLPRVYPSDQHREGDNLGIDRALDEAQPGDVLVVNGFSDVNRAVFGDLLAEICLARVLPV